MRNDCGTLRRRRSVRVEPSSVSQPQRILLIRLSHLGDVVHALPVFHALRASFPRARIGWVTQPEFAGLLEGLDGLERVFRFGRSEGAGAWPRLAAELASFSPELVVDAQGNLKSATTSLCAGSARRTGLHHRDWREPAGAWVLHDWAPPVELEEPHAMDRMLGLARYVSGGDGIVLRTDPGLSASELDSGREAFRGLAGADGAEAPTFVLQLSPPQDVRSWPLEHFAALARKLAEEGTRVVAISGPREVEIGRALRERLADAEGISHWVGQCGLRELASFFGAAAQAGAVFAGCDSGPMHLAAACGMRVVTLAGPQSHRRTGPWPIAAGLDDPSPPAETLHRVLRSLTPPACAPCFDRRCTHAEGPVCMSGISPARVAAGLLGLASSAPAPVAP
jgi:ADP-heptose:LPS heptosyltransferase